MMLPKLSLAAAILSIGLLSPQLVAAAPLQQTNVSDSATLIQTVAHRRHNSSRHSSHRRHFRRHHHRGVRIYAGGGSCYRWRHICANRHGWHSRGYYRCVRRHGC
jgi:hypothetical protein